MPTRRPQLQRHPEPVVHIPVIRVPQADGSLLIKPGRPEVLKGDDEVSTAQFARDTGLSERHVLTLIDEGQIKARPMSPKQKSRWRIPRGEVARYLKLEKA